MITLERLFASYAAATWRQKAPTADDHKLLRLLSMRASFARLVATRHPLVISFMNDLHNDLVSREVTPGKESIRGKLHREIARRSGANRRHVQLPTTWRPESAPLGTTFSVRQDLLGGMRAFAAGQLTDDSWRGKIDRLFSSRLNKSKR